MSDYLGYADKVCVVTGAASGMGRALTEILVDFGAKVYAIDRVESPIPGVTRSIVANLGDKDSIDEVFAGLPDTIGAFFGVAGVAGVHNTFLETMTVNYIANKYITDTYLGDRLAEGGSITFVTSNGGLRWELPGLREELVPFTQTVGWAELVGVTEDFNAEFGGELPGFRGYILSKRALNLLVAEQAGPLAGLRKIRINAVLPAMTVSGMIGDFAEMRGGMDKLEESSIGPAGRLAEAVDMARVLTFLGSDLAGYVSGAHLSVDFGMNSLELAGLKPDRLRWTMRDALSAQPA
ncbi:SDR family oxidoreductase [Herbiconiux daphne]|uniref:SDR family oxidoreductase n=1 Tax=Herbiconiux daphne TaxID=2970914 RepID=A0ABT2H813_9MICO|nr:SDR family oxidoreductase [Herbiconiux daphne]MCS5736068.1 SDR family oxidoreductase [Herbiconiux daphne]